MASRSLSAITQPLGAVGSQISAGLRAPFPTNVPQDFALVGSPGMYDNPLTPLQFKYVAPKAPATTLLGGLANFGQLAFSTFTGNYAAAGTQLARTALAAPAIKPGGNLMAYYDPTSGAFSETPPIISGGSGGFSLGDIFGDVSGSQILGLGSQLLTAFGNYGGQTVSSPSPQPVSAMMPAIRAGAIVGRAFFNRFPNLAAGIQRLRNAGQNVSRSKVYSLLKRFGPDFLVTGGILTAAAVSELAVAGPGRRRMNPANVKALRRAHRRMASFHHICRKNDALMHRGGRKRSTGFARGTTITQVK